MLIARIRALAISKDMIVKKSFSFIAAAALFFWTTAAFAQSASPAPGSAASGKSTSDPADKPAAGTSPAKPAAPNTVAPTSEIGRFGNFVGSPSTGNDNSSPAPVPGSPPTAPR